MQLHNYITKKLQDKFVKNFMTLFTGSIAGQAILFAFTPFLTRIYPEELFGLLFIFSSLAAVLRVVASLRFEISVVLPKEDKHAINLLVIAVLLNTLINIFFLLLISVFYDIFLEFSGYEKLGNWLYAVPLSSFLLGMFEIFSYWSNRLEKYKDISFSKISKSSVTGTSQVLLKYTMVGQNGLILGVLAGQLMAFLHIFMLSFKSLAFNLQFLSIKKSRVLLRRYREIPIYNTLIGTLNTLSNQLPILLLAKFYGPEPAAYYGLANRVVMTPMGLLAQSVGQVFYKTSTDIVNKGGKLFKPVIKTYKGLFLTGLVPFLAIFGISFLFDFIFGEGWENAGIYTRILIPWLFIAYLNSPLSWVLIVLNKQKIVSVFDFILLTSRFLAIYLTYLYSYNHFVSISVFSAVGFFYGLFMFIYIIYVSKSDVKPYSNKKT